MRLTQIARRTTTVIVATLLLHAGAAQAAEIKVVSSGGFAAAYKALAPSFEAASHDKLLVDWGPSMGETPQAIPNRLQRGERLDVLIMVGAALDDLAKQGKVVPDSRVVLAKSYTGAAVRAGAPKPDISTVDSFKRTLLAAKSIAFSDSASGVYLSTVLFPKLGVADQIKGKSRMIPAEPVGLVVARGEAELGFQQISELVPIPGIEILGPLPAEIQQVTLYSAGIPVDAPNPAGAKALIAYLTSPEAAPTVTKTGLEPITASAKK